MSFKTAIRIQLAWMMMLLSILQGGGLTAADTDLTSTGVTARHLLEQSDQVRNTTASAMVRTRVTHYKNEKVEQESVLEVYAKGPEKVLVKSLDPRSRGLRVLLLGDDMWISLPDVSRPVRITPAQRLVGQASNGDVARTYYAVDYEPRLVREETVAGKKCALLELTARRKSATYRRIEYWVDLKTAAPVQANFYLTSGKHSKFAVFEEFKTFEGHRMVSKITIHDRIQGKERTTLEHLEVRLQDIPDRYFHTSRMMEF
jgi:outer membrane lipoprotein-sorting protein